MKVRYVKARIAASYEEALARQTVLVCKELAALGCGGVELQYSGCGDSGEIEHVSYYLFHDEENGLREEYALARADLRTLCVRTIPYFDRTWGTNSAEPQRLCWMGGYRPRNPEVMEGGRSITDDAGVHMLLPEAVWPSEKVELLLCTAAEMISPQGYENNEGGQGTVTVDTRARKLMCSHTDNAEHESETLSLPLVAHGALRQFFEEHQPEGRVVRAYHLPFWVDRDGDADVSASSLRAYGADHGVPLTEPDPLSDMLRAVLGGEELDELVEQVEAAYARAEERGEVLGGPGDVDNAYDIQLSCSIWMDFAPGAGWNMYCLVATSFIAQADEEYDEQDLSDVTTDLTEVLVDESSDTEE